MKTAKAITPDDVLINNIYVYIYADFFLLKLI